MPTYEFVCTCGQAFEVRLPLADISGKVACPTCGEQARRRYSAPFVPPPARSPLTGDVDRAARTAGEPPVVPAPPRRGRTRGAATNPLHRYLPKP